MKVILNNYGETYYYSLADVATATGQTVNALWCMVYRTQTLPKPTIRLAGKRRLYYPADVYELITARVGETTLAE